MKFLLRLLTLSLIATLPHCAQAQTTVPTEATALQTTQGTAGTVFISPRRLSGLLTASYQPLDGDLTAVAGLSSTGIVRRTASNTFSAGTTVAATEGGTGFTSYAVGDILWADTTTSLAKLTIGSSGTFLRSAGSSFTWATQALNYIGGVSGASVPATATTKGDFYAITAAGTSQSKTWAVGDIAIYEGTSGNWTQVVLGSVSYTKAESDARKSGDAPRGGIISTGAAAVGTTQDNTGLAFGTADFSIGAWVRLPDWTPSTNKYVFWKYNTSTFLGTLLTVMTDGTLRLSIGNGASATAYVSTAATGITDGAWAHIAVTADRDGNAVFYVNGSALGTAVSIAAQSAQTLTNTNAAIWMSDGTSGHTAGTLGEAWIINGLLTATNVADIYRAGSIAPFAASFTFYQWLDFGQGYGPIIKDRGNNATSSQPALMGTSGLSHAVPRNPPGIPQRAPRAAIVGDGSNGSFTRTTLNTQNPGTGEFSWWWDGVVPSDVSATTKAIAALNPSATADAVAGTSSLTLAYSTGAGLHLYFLASDTVSSRYYTSVAALTLLAGKRCVLVARRNSSGMKLFLGVDGDFIDATYLFAETTGGGSPPAWTASIDGQYLRAFDRTTTNSSAHTLYDIRLANVAMTEAQLRTEYERGEPSPEWIRGSNTALYSSNFSAGVDSWTSDSGRTVTGNNDSVGGEDDWAKIENTSGGVMYVNGYRLSLLALGQSYRVVVKVRTPSGSPITHISIGGSVGGVAPTAGQAVAADTTTTLTFRNVRLSSSSLSINGANAAGLEQQYAAGTLFYFKDLVVTPEGYTARLRTDLAAGLTAIDGSSNKQDFLLSTTGVTTSPNGRRQIIRPGTQTFTSPGTLNLQLFGASVVDTAKKWRIVSVTGTSNASVNLSLGSASAGAQYISAQAVTAADFDIGTFASRVINGANVWLASSNTATITNLVVILDQVD